MSSLSHGRGTGIIESRTSSKSLVTGNVSWYVFHHQACLANSAEPVCTFAETGNGTLTRSDRTRAATSPQPKNDWKRGSGGRGHDEAGFDRRWATAKNAGATGR